MAGLRFLIAGSVWGLNDDRENAISCYRQCLSARNFSCSDGVTPDTHDKHITVFALYELGVLLLDSPNVSNIKFLNFMQIVNFNLHLTLLSLSEHTTFDLHFRALKRGKRC